MSDVDEAVEAVRLRLEKCYEERTRVLLDTSPEQIGTISFENDARQALEAADPHIRARALAGFKQALLEWLNARESSALVQAETASENGTLRWQARGRAEAYRDALDHLAAKEETDNG